MITTYNNTLAVLALTSAARVDGTDNGLDIDTNVFDNRFRDVAFLIAAATVTDGDHVVTVEESDTGGGANYAAVPADRVFGTLPELDNTNSDSVFSFGARPTKRYVRVVIATTGATTGGVIGAQAVLGNGSYQPVARS